MLTKHLLLEAIAGTGSNLPVYVRFPGSPEEFPCRVSVEGLQGGVPRIILTSEAPMPSPGTQDNFSLTGGTPVDGTEQANEPQKTVDHFATGDKAIGGTMIHTESPHDQVMKGEESPSKTSEVTITKGDDQKSDEAQAAGEAENLTGNDQKGSGSTSGSAVTGSTDTASEGNAGSVQGETGLDSDSDGINDDEDPDDFSDLDNEASKAE